MAGIPGSLLTDAQSLVERHRECFLRLAGARLLITGGTGFLGRWLMLSLLHAANRLNLDCSAVLLTRDPARCLALTPWYGDSRLRLLPGDLRSLPAHAVGRFTHVIHAAADPIGEAGALAGIESAFHGTSNLLGLVGMPEAERFLLISSGAVYGRTEGWTAETCRNAPDPLDAQLAYHHGKRMAETLCAAGRAAGRLRHCSIARIFTAIGPWQPPDCGFAAADLLRDAVQGGPLIVQGDGSALRSYLYAADLSAWLWEILLGGADGGVYNVGGDTAVSITELASTISARHPARPPVRILGKPVAGRAGSHYLPDTSRARNDLGLKAWTGLVEAIDRTLAFQQTAP